MSTYSNILRRIIEAKRQEIAASKNSLSAELLSDIANASTRTPLSMKKALSVPQPSIIAEFKRRSPSKGEINTTAMPAKVVADYQTGGAAACSILTDTPFFGGALTDLAIARANTSLPLLRKDFVIDPYQIDQALIYGADAILLIASALSGDEIGCLAEYAHSRKLEVLLELHSPDELSKYTVEADMVGINNRNLNTFATDLNASTEMAKLLPQAAIKVAESGIKTYHDIEMLSMEGYAAFLIGETFMKTADPGLTLKQFIYGNE